MTKALERRLPWIAACLVLLPGHLPAASPEASVHVLQRDTYLVPGTDAVAHVAEFTDSAGKVTRSIDIDNPKEGDRAVSALAVASANGQLLVLTKKTRSVSDRNPYLARKNLDTEVSWYRSDGTRLGKKDFVWAATGVAAASNGKLFAVVDEGFDPYDGDSQPDLSKASKEDRLIDLSYHVLYIFDLKGREVWQRRIKGSTNAPPKVVGFSPSGEWLLVQFGGNHIAVNLRAKTEKEIQTDLVLKEIADEGTVIGWKKESDTGRWETRADGTKYWLSGKIKQRKFVLKKDETEFVRTEEVRES